MDRRTAMVGVLGTMLFLSYFYRTSPAVIAPDLSREFSLGAERLGLLSSIFLAVFALAQVPLGPALSSSNFFAIGGAAFRQYLMGWMIERHPPVGRGYPIEAYREAFLLLLAGMAFSLLLYWKAAESRRANTA